MDSSFAKLQLSKHGWTEGSGLGREESGITEALKVKYKFDTTGVGHNAGDEFTYHWWDHMFNKAAGNIEVKNSDEGVVVNKAGEFQISKSKPLPKGLAAKNLLYGTFVKAATLLNDGNLHKEEEETPSSDSESEPDPERPVAAAMTDEELFKICGGRTAHKGARHGLKLSGKLMRIQQQEVLALASLAASSEDKGSAKKHKKNKHKKNKHKDLIDSEQKSDSTECDKITKVESESKIQTENDEEHKVKKKKSKKNKSEKCNIVKSGNILKSGSNEGIETTDASGIDILTKQDKVDKRKKNLINVDSETVVEFESKSSKKRKLECLVNVDGSLPKKKKKSKKSKEHGKVEASDLLVNESSGTHSSKTKKKKKLS